MAWKWHSDEDVGFNCKSLKSTLPGTLIPLNGFSTG